jgi:ATP-binding cassette, subfamily B, multidrug efflux pump
MKPIFRLAPFTYPYWKKSALALLGLTTLVVLDLSIPRLIQRIIDQGIKTHNQQLVIHTGLIMLGISILSMTIAVWNSLLSVRVGEGVARDLRDAVFLKIQSLSFGNLDRMQTGQLMVRLTSDTSAIQRVVQISLRIGTRAPLLMLGSLILMIKTSPSLALSIAPVLVVALAVIIWFIIKLEPFFQLVQQKLDRLNTVLQENVAGVRLIKAFVRADHEAGRFETSNTAFTDHSIRVMRVMAGMTPLLTLCINVGIVVVVWSGGLNHIKGDLTIGQIVAFINYLMTSLTPLTMMTNLSNAWANGAASARRLCDLFDVVPEVRDATEPVELPKDSDGHPIRIEFQGVSFQYGGHGSGPVLTDIDLVAEPGKTFAVLGATGAGKSSLVHLIPRFYEVTDGRVLLDGVDVRLIAQERLNAAIAMVPQDTVLFSGSVRDNVRYGKPDADESAVMAAAQAAQAHDFILKLPNGYDTHVEERGVNLSGGQKQRIAIARAILVEPRILILDDSTSAVDVETETRIQEALDALAFRPTRIVVAQRISTVLRADRIIVLDKGRIVGAGTHPELMGSSPIYQEIYASQLGNGFENSESEDAG